MLKISESKQQLLINKREGKDTKNFNNSEASIDCSNYMDDIYINIKEYNPNEKQKH